MLDINVCYFSKTTRYTSTHVDLDLSVFFYRQTRIHLQHVFNEFATVLYYVIQHFKLKINCTYNSKSEQPTTKAFTNCRDKLPPSFVFLNTPTCISFVFSLLLLFSWLHLKVNLVHYHFVILLQKSNMRI